MKKVMLFIVFCIIFSILNNDISFAQEPTLPPPNVNMENEIDPEAVKDVEIKVEIVGFWGIMNHFMTEYKRQIYIWLAWTIGLFLLGVYGIFFPLFYYVFRFHPSFAIRMAYVMAILGSYICFHLIFLTPYIWTTVYGAIMFSGGIMYWKSWKIWIVWLVVLITMSLITILSLPKNKNAF